MSARLFLGCFLAVAALPAAASASDIVRCIAAGGGITYQQAPCPEASSERFLAIATEYPAPNLAERDRLLQREAALYRRLEARREREAQEAVLREERQEREASLERARVTAAAAAAVQFPQLIVVSRWPGRRATSGTPRNRPTW
ncbi:MAG: hypothetical protein M3R58_17410 [Pseudomonadota bacterium]|nr:hypothetical protein [Pseudomonadota bacterium]